MKDDQLNGQFIEYFPSGNIKAIRLYENNVLDGESREYNENGDVLKLYVFKNGNEIFERIYSINGSKSESYFRPIITIPSDTLHLGEDSLYFEIELPVEDSLLEGKEFMFTYQAKPLEMKDSIIPMPKFQLRLHNKGLNKGLLEIKERKNQIFYGQLFDKKDSIAFFPFEKEIFVIRINN